MVGPVENTNRHIGDPAQMETGANCLGASRDGQYMSLLP